MRLSAARCAFRMILSGKPVCSSSVNVFTFTALQYHKVQLKCLQINFASVLRKTSMSFASKRQVHITTVLSKNYYDVLGVPRNANQKQIKDAYYKLAMKYHPDKNQGKLTQQFREIKEAYDVLSNESSRIKYNSSNNNKSTSDNWSSDSFYDRYKSPHYEEYNWTNSRTEYQRPYSRRSYDYSHLRPYNVFINVINVPKNVVKTQLDILMLTFIKNRILKTILFTLFQFIWTQVVNNLNYNVLLSSTTQINSLGEFVKKLLTSHTVRIELTELEAIRGKAVRVQVVEKEKVLVVNIPGGVKKDQSFYLFYLTDDDSNKF